MIKLLRTDSGNPDFVELVRQLDVYLAEADGHFHSFYHQFNGIDALKEVVIAYIDGIPAGCGALKQLSESEMEVKRMYTRPEFRNQRIASGVLSELEYWASELGFEACILETGTKQTEALQFYPAMGYEAIPNYGQYAGMENSRCFRKKL